MTYEDLDKVPYAAAVIYEGMRMWPPVTPAVGLVCIITLLGPQSSWDMPDPASKGSPAFDC